MARPTLPPPQNNKKWMPDYMLCAKCQKLPGVVLVEKPIRTLLCNSCYAAQSWDENDLVKPINK